MNCNVQLWKLSEQFWIDNASSLYRAARFANFEGILGFSVPSIILVGGVMQNTTHRARPAFTIKIKLGAFSIKLKIPEISVGTSDGTDHFGLIRPEYS